MSEKHGAVQLPMSAADVRRSQSGAAAPLYDKATGLRQCGTVAFTVALSPRATKIHDLNALEEVYEPLCYQEALELVDRDDRNICSELDGIFP
eukprot:4857284-Pyramimonas_sp.AAC.1